MRTRPVNDSGIVEISCKKLFGLYDYRLHPAYGASAGDTSMLLLYGDNGSGKTTLLQLIFHLLSPRENRGHRTFIGNTKFNRFTILFRNGSSIEAVREPGKDTGSYTVRMNGANGGRTCIYCAMQPDNRVAPTDVHYGGSLKKAGIGPLDIHYLSDTRVYLSDLLEHVFDPDEELFRARMELRSSYRHNTRTASLDIDPAVRRAETWIRQEAIAASSVSEQNISTIYEKILRELSNPTVAPDGETHDSIGQLVARLTHIAVESELAAEFGLAQRIRVDEIMRILNSLQPSHERSVLRVLRIYIDSIQSRVDATRMLALRLMTFRNIINSSYKGKVLQIKALEGFSIEDRKGNRLEPEVLSSGEKQLMLLLCNALTIDKPSLFLIDEPELSLNIKWQRNLIRTLLDLVQERKVQFVMATHSIELLTNHHNSVLKLDEVL